MRFFTTLLSALFLLLYCSFAVAAEGSAVVVTVNGVDLTRAELDQEMAKLLPMERNFHGGMSKEKVQKIEKKAMEALVEMELQYQDGLSKGLKLDKKKMELEVERLAANYPDKDLYLDAVKKAGFTDMAMERFIERNVVAKLIKTQEVDQKLKVTDEQVLAHYEQNKGKYLKPEEYRASIILVKVPPSSTKEQRAEYRKKIDDVLQEYKKGADFGDLASKSSDDMSRIKGGDLGPRHFGQMEQAFEDQIKKMKIGDISEVMEVLEGYYLIKLTEKKGAHQLSFEDAKEKIKNQMITKEKERLFSTWMDGLRNKAKIVYPPVAKLEKG